MAPQFRCGGGEGAVHSSVPSDQEPRSPPVLIDVDDAVGQNLIELPSDEEDDDPSRVQ